MFAAMTRRRVLRPGLKSVARGLVAALLWMVVPAGAALAQARDPVVAASEVFLEVRRFEIAGSNPLSAAETDAVLAPHLGSHRNLASLEAAPAALEARLRERGHSFHRVIIPAQKPADGVVKLEILQFPLATVEVTGNNHFSADNIRRSMPSLTAGDAPDVGAISRDLGLANEHSSKRISIVLKESAKADALDAEIRVRDVEPSMFFLGLTSQTKDAYDDINKATGHTRLTFGFQNTNLFDRDHALTLTYTTSTEHPERVKQYAAFYWMPLYGLATSLQMYYTRSDVSTGALGLGANSFNVSGRGEFFGLRLSHSLPKWQEWVHSVSVAVDDRFFDNNTAVTFGGLSANTTTPVRSRPAALRYTMRWDQPWGGIGAHAEQVTNLPGGSWNNDLSYGAVRTNANRRWTAFRYGLDASYLLGTWTATARLRGQHTGSLLIPGEQFGLGGVTSVRGLREREMTGDTGYTMTLELNGPPMAMAGGVRPVVFLDHGHVKLLDNSGRVGTTVNQDTATSVGVGARWNHERRVDLSLDLAYVLNGIASSGSIPGTKAGDTKLMLNALIRF